MLLSSMIFLASCTKTETKFKISVTEFNTNDPISDANVEIIEVSNIEFGPNGKIADRNSISNQTLDANGQLEYISTSDFEELEFLITKDGYIEYFSWDAFVIEQGDDVNLNIEMFQESFILFKISDVPYINNDKMEFTLRLHEDDNLVHQFNGGSAELLKRANGGTDNTVLISRDNGVAIPEIIPVPLRDTLVYEIQY